MVHDDDIHHCIWSLWEECTDGQTQKEDGIYQLISNAENEMKEYAHKVKQLSADKIYQHSAETAAKENLLCSIIHDSYDLDDADLAKIFNRRNRWIHCISFFWAEKPTCHRKAPFQAF